MSVSKHATVTLHLSEEAISVDASGVLSPVPQSGQVNPISEYFSTTKRLATKITTPAYGADPEILGLLLLGVVSAAEFYFRSVLGVSMSICPLCREASEMFSVPVASFDFYSGSGYSHSLGGFEHESLADAKKIRAECKRFTGFDLVDDLSVKKAIEDFDVLCELRHCLVHTSGFAGLKACKALQTPARCLQKILINQAEAFELMKLAHNAVRAFNRFVANAILNRWVDRELFSGRWKFDKKAFDSVIHAFWIKGEDAYSSISRKAYKPFQKAALGRLKGTAAQVREKSEKGQS